jgi:hypothetical protein
MHKVFKGRGLWSYTGKDNQGNRDDMTICFLFAAYYSQVVAKKVQSRQQFLEQSF